MRFLLVFILLTLFLNTFNSQTVEKCNSDFSPHFPGELCDLKSFPVCDHGYDCLNNTVDSQGQAFCQPIVNIQTQCNFTSQCTGVGLACISNLCLPKRWAGEQCNTGDDCLTLNCNTNGICEGLSLNTSCVASYDNKCDKGLFCAFNGTFYPNGTAAGNCIQSLPEGTNCVNEIGFGIIRPRPLTDIASACAAGTLCDVQTGVCTKPGSVAAGVNASLAASCDFGLAFSESTGCVNYCGTGPNDPKCVSGYYCNCGSTNSQGTCQTNPCKTQTNAVISCMAQNDCRDVWVGPEFQSLVWRSLVNGTCVYNLCQTQVWDYECCITNFGTRGDLTPGVSCSIPATPEPAPAVASTLSSCFLLILSVIFFIFVVYL